MAAETVGSLAIKIGVDLTDFETKMKEFNKTFGKLGGQMEEVGRSIGTSFTAGGAAIATALGFAVKAAADSETQLAKMETAMQGNTEAAKEYLEWAKEFGKTTPFEASEVVDATIKLKAYGIEAKTTLEQIGNMAAGMGKGLDQAIEAVADAQTGELERLKEFGITKQMLIDKALELGKGEIVNAKGQITDLEGMNDALMSIMEERFDGGMKRMSQTLMGQISALKDSFTQFSVTIGNVLLPVITNVAGFLQQVADKFNQLSPATQKFIAIGAALTAGLMILTGVVGFMTMALGMMAAAQWAVILPIAGIVAGIALLIAVLTAAFAWMWQNNEDFRDGVLSIWNEIKAGAEMIFNDLKIFWDTWGGSITAVFKGMWNAIQIVFTAALKLIGNSLGLWLAIFRGDWEDAWKHMQNAGKIIWDAIAKLFGNFENTIGDIWDSLLGKTVGTWDSVKQTIKASVNSIISSINAFIGGVNSIRISVPSVDIPLVGTVGGFSIGMPQIPKIPMLADGGITTGPTLAMIGEAGQEAVIPLDRLDQMGGATTIIVELDGRTIAKSTLNYMGGTFRARGVVT